jgi:hypothetical protein
LRIIAVLLSEGETRRRKSAFLFDQRQERLVDDLLDRLSR